MASVLVGIDLGTTNSAVACSVSPEVGGSTKPTPLVVPQISRPGVLTESFQLPSLLYIPLADELRNDANRLPWGAEEYFIGAYAKDRAAEAPDRVVVSAKSWLCNAQMDRKSAFLPWGAQLAEGLLSPFEASRQYLLHLKRAIENQQSLSENFSEADVVLTVPASFDEVARTLTAEAAQAAGFERVSLLEEPLAALYAWIAQSEDTWREQISVGDCILVFDVGGGTADFSLVLVSEEQGELTLERLSVGDHILLGGDNMDLAVAYYLRQRLSERGAKLDTWQFQSLVHQSRRVKERLLAGMEEQLPVSIAGKGSSLFASTLQCEITRAELEQLILEGFFPPAGFGESPAEGSGAGIQEIGLPFAADPALTRHLSSFLAQSNAQVALRSDLPEAVVAKARESRLMPTAILFNGGVCSADSIRQRLLEVLRSWPEADSVRELSGTSYELAVALGAAHYAHIRQSGKGLRIRAGIPRSYYLGIESAMPAVPGFRPPVKGVCVVAQGMEEGSESTLSEQTFTLRTGKEVEFRFFSSHQRPTDTFGLVIDDVEALLDETSRLRVVLPSDGAHSSVPVKLFSRINDLGILELWMQAHEGDAQWKLEFDVRAEKKTLLTRQNMPQVASSV
jgi:hypothetical protein